MDGKFKGLFLNIIIAIIKSNITMICHTVYTKAGNFRKGVEMSDYTLCDKLIREYAVNYMEKVFYFALKKTGSEAEAENLCSDITLNIFLQLKKGNIPVRFTSWAANSPIFAGSMSMGTSPARASAQSVCTR